MIFQTQILSNKLRKLLRGKEAAKDVYEAENSENAAKNDSGKSELLSIKDIESGPILGFRTGTSMFDGFDDFSTMISSDVSTIFSRITTTQIGTSIAQVFEATYQK